MLDKKLLEKYRKHPRIIEIRFIMTYRVLEREYGLTGALNLVEGLCSGFNRSFPLINNALSKRYDMFNWSRHNQVLWKQQVLFAGLCGGLTISKTCKTYLGVLPTNIYPFDYYDPYNYVNDEWLDRLDDDVIACGNSQIRNEVIGFLDILEDLAKVLHNLGGR